MLAVVRNGRDISVKMVEGKLLPDVR